LITFLRPGLVIIKKSSEEKVFFVEEGIVEFKNNNLLILSSTATNLNDLSKDSINLMITNSQEKMNTMEINDKEKYLAAHKIDTLREIN
jgi:F-type H+-transporting ATPase subunit epsilon